ncbi:Rad4-domain-containing protein [Pyrenochaeta sp. DS3sAY3a]|nr:Rad4-domain-containing protein [Pyrenochaeta sp. DS3sAY3a]
MPPKLSRKRLRSESPIPAPPPKQARTGRRPARHGKESVFQTLDAPARVKRTLSQTKAFLDQEASSGLSSPDSTDDEFEDVPLGLSPKGKAQADEQQDEDADESEDEDWEDALGAHHRTKPDHGPTPVISGDIALTLSAAPKTAFESKPDGKRGPSKVQRQIRNVTHCMHVQYLMFSNLLRNGWIQDKDVQSILVQSLPVGCWREVERYWRDVGITDGPTRAVVPAPNARQDIQDTPTKKGQWKDCGNEAVKLFDATPNKRDASQKGEAQTAVGKGKRTSKKDRDARDWGKSSEVLETATPNLSAGEPMLRLLRYLSAYWKSKFRITTPSLRKRGYLSPATLKEEINAWRKDPSHASAFGERIEDLQAFREKARKCEGSRDVGQQLFTALLRGVGIEARMVVSLQPVGFGWSQSEEGKPKNLEKLKDVPKFTPNEGQARSTLAANRMTPRPASSNQKILVRSNVSDSELSSVISISSDSDERLVRKSPKARSYAEDIPYPTYWTEVISHLTHTPISVSPFPRISIASQSSPEKYVDFYARGVAADKAKQVFAYLIAFSSDGTAKDVTTRYLPKRQWPGRTKGSRMPVEKIPIHNKRGKVKRWEEWDWFKSVLRLYDRPHEKCQPWDEIEDENDLVPAEPEKKKLMDEEGGKETLQGYKNSAEYVLERHLRREEALKPGAKIIRRFVTGKGDSEKSEPVYRRIDIVSCKTAESWHKEGREIKEGEQPLKFVPYRAVTVTRKREIEERERIEGGKVQQGLYSKVQTDWIIPDPIIDGKIPRNAFGNIDVYVPTMIPKGAVHIPLKGAARICRKLNVDYAEACTGFEFGKQRAVPVLTGVVVAVEYEDMVIDAWELEAVEKAKKEADKREKLVLGLWKKFYSGLRIVERMKAEYGEDVELPAKRPNRSAHDASGPKNSEWDVFNNNKDFEGGFLRDDAGPSEGGFIRGTVHHREDESLFPASQDDVVHGDLMIDRGGEVESERTENFEGAIRTPISLTSALQLPVSEAQSDTGAIGESEMGQDYRDPTSEDEEDALPASSSKLRKEAPPRASRSQQRISLVKSSKREPRPQPATRSIPKRRAARKSDAQIKSHFFVNEGDAETDLTDMTDRNSPVKKTGAKRRGKDRSAKVEARKSLGRRK